MLAVLAGSLFGCQQYHAKPLESAADRAEFLARATDSPQVAEFARRLSGEGQDAAAQAGGAITLHQAEAVALAFNPALRIARLKAGVTRATLDHAGLYQDPVLGVDLTRIIQSAANPWKVMATVGFTLPISGRLEIETKRAGAENAAAVLRVYAAEWQARTELRAAWWRCIAAKQRAVVVAELVERTGQIVSLVERMQSAGELSRIEGRLFSIDLVSKRLERARLEAEAAQAELAIKQIMGLAPASVVTLATESVPVGADRTNGGFAEVERRSPLLAIARAEYEAAEKALELEIARQTPDLQIGPGYGREDGQDQFLLGVSLPLPLWNRNQQAIARATAERELARAEVQTTAERLESELAGATGQFEAVRTQRTTLENELVPMVDLQSRETREIARLGEVNALIVLEALKAELESKLKLIDATLAERLAAVRMQTIIGPPAGTANAGTNAGPRDGDHP